MGMRMSRSERTMKHTYELTSKGVWRKVARRVRDIETAKAQEIRVKDEIECGPISAAWCFFFAVLHSAREKKSFDRLESRKMVF